MFGAYWSFSMFIWWLILVLKDRQHLSFYILKLTFLAVALFEKLKDSGKDLLQQSSESSIPSSS